MWELTCILPRYIHCLIVANTSRRMCIVTIYYCSNIVFRHYYPGTEQEASRIIGTVLLSHFSRSFPNLSHPNHADISPKYLKSMCSEHVRNIRNRINSQGFFTVYGERSDSLFVYASLLLINHSIDAC